MRPFERVLVAGTGLLGASFGLALKNRGLAREVVGLGRTRENLETALRRGAIDRFSLDPVEAAEDADLVLLASPVRSLADVARATLPAARPDVLVTDVGSVKESVVRAVEPLVQAPARFVPSHPIAGSERSGSQAADAALFEGRPCVLTPTERTDARAVERVRELWEALGMRVVTMTPAAHDRLLARVSHLPHVVAWALVDAAATETIEGIDPLSVSGGSFRDTSRVAASHPEVWTDILLDNRDEVLAALDRFEGALGHLRERIRANDAAGLAAEIERLGDVRRRYREGS